MASPNSNPISEISVGCTLCGIEDFRILSNFTPCKHYYSRQREAQASKVHTVGESCGRLGELFKTPGGGVHTTPLPTFFDLDIGSLIVPFSSKDKKAWTFRMKRTKN